MARQKKVKFGVAIRENVFDMGYHIYLIPVYEPDATFDDWVKALKFKWKEIKNLIDSGELGCNKPRPSFLKREQRKHATIKWKVFKKDNFTCKHCGSQEFLEVDHIIPISKGGSNQIENLQTLCKKCNLTKRDKL